MSASRQMNCFVGGSTLSISAKVCDITAGKVSMFFDPSIISHGYAASHFDCFEICDVPHEAFIRPIVCQKSVKGVPWLRANGCMIPSTLGAHLNISS